MMWIKCSDKMPDIGKTGFYLVSIKTEAVPKSGFFNEIPEKKYTKSYFYYPKEIMKHQSLEEVVYHKRWDFHDKKSDEIIYAWAPFPKPLGDE